MIFGVAGVGDTSGLHQCVHILTLSLPSHVNIIGYSVNQIFDEFMLSFLMGILTATSKLEKFLQILILFVRQYEDFAICFVCCLSGSFFSFGLVSIFLQNVIKRKIVYTDNLLC